MVEERSTAVIHGEDGPAHECGKRTEISTRPSSILVIFAFSVNTDKYERGSEGDSVVRTECPTPIYNLQTKAGVTWSTADRRKPLQALFISLSIISHASCLASFVST